MASQQNTCASDKPGHFEKKKQKTTILYGQQKNIHFVCFIYATRVVVIVYGHFVGVGFRYEPFYKEKVYKVY